MLGGGLVAALGARVHDLARVPRVDVVLEVRPEGGGVGAVLAPERLHGDVHRLLVLADVADLVGAVVALLALVPRLVAARVGRGHVVHEVDAQRELEAQSDIIWKIHSKLKIWMPMPLVAIFIFFSDLERIASLEAAEAAGKVPQLLVSVSHVEVEAALGRRRVRAQVAREEEGARVRRALVRLQHRAVRRDERAVEA